MVAISNKKVLHDEKIDGISVKFSPRCVKVVEAPRGEKITHGDPTESETEMSNLCVYCMCLLLKVFGHVLLWTDVENTF